MADIFSPQKRSEIMKKIRSKNTSHEVTIRKMIFSMGYRYRLHKKELPGKPDIVFPKLKKVIFIHGCFWHGHKRCKRATIPSTNQEFWKEKIKSNIDRDKNVRRKLTKLGWKSLILWQCQIKKANESKLKTKIEHFLKTES